MPNQSPPPRDKTPASSTGTGQINTLSALAALLVRPVLSSVWYNKKDVTLDGYCFVSCRFDNCLLRVNTTEFELDKCFIDADCTILYGDKIVRIPQLLFARIPTADELFPHFVPIRHPDGTITIK